VEPAVESAVTNGMTARLVRVAGRTFTEKEPVLRKTVFQPDDNLTGMNTRVVQGHDGVRVREFKVVIEDGVETQKTLTKESFEVEPVNTVIYYPTASLRATGFEASNFNSSGKPATDPSYGFTYTGVPVTFGIVAVDPRVIPLGTRLYIPGYGFAVAADTGGGIVGNMIDLGFPDGVAVDWHTGWTEIYILAP
jgi:3D (Asp-Asp-Asp) domain-containing protein